MVSFDAVSLFINVSPPKTIEIITNRLYPEDDPLLNQLSFKKEVFKKLTLCFTQELFAYKDRLYKQIERVTMGFPLGPTMANFLLSHLKEKIFADKSICWHKLRLVGSPASPGRATSQLCRVRCIELAGFSQIVFMIMSNRLVLTSTSLLCPKSRLLSIMRGLETLCHFTKSVRFFK